MSCRDESVRGKHQAGRGQNARFGKGKSCCFHQAKDVLNRQKRGVAFVHVMHRWPHTESFQCAVASDPEKDFLAHAHLQVAAIKLRGNFSVFGPVGWKIRIEQVELNPAHVHLPDLRVDSPVRQFDRHLDVGD
jgi:hypothetical protein